MTIVAGIHAVQEFLRTTPERMLKLSVQRNRRDAALAELIRQARMHDIQVAQVSREALDRMCDDVAHQGVAARCQAFQPHSESEFEALFATLENPFLLAIEGVLDPRNLGACLRSAEGAGVHAVLIPRNRSAPLSSAAFKSASGALSSLFVVGIGNLARRIEWLQAKGVWVVGTDDQADTRFIEHDYRVPTLVVVGGEENGLRELTKARCDALVSIPMAGRVASLNVSVATGVVLYEGVRQRES
ncbi:MAG: 23S rRNA (guanosine(2251)-2'-O)-methyltransferase RlmB [Gammaproteobacteria bacterium]|nr:23S rRNA (guanosine(2251)-2'-O)-methyltransferase RlmB [Gammaproteobacteria bacterium]